MIQKINQSKKIFKGNVFWNVLGELETGLHPTDSANSSFGWKFYFPAYGLH